MLTSVAALGVLTLCLATLLVLAYLRLRVEEDPRIDEVERMLPHANCGACGHPGCRAFAEALVRGDAAPVACTVSSPDGHAKLAAFLGVSVGTQVRRVARLACAGGTNVALAQARYAGQSSCAAAALVAGGAKACSWGCLGEGDCERACDFDAIRMSEHQLPVVDEALCTACGACVEACPKDLFRLIPVDRCLFVRCRSEEQGEAALAACEVACTGCGRCAQDAPQWITMHRHLPVIDTARPHRDRTAIERCPTGAIVWFDSMLGPLRGREAAPLLHKEPRPVVEQDVGNG